MGHTTGAVSWSAFGNYVACACGRSLDAVALNGRVVWTERYAGPVATPAWSPDGNRIAFTVGRELYVSAGDGTGARGLRPLGADAVPALAAWRPGPGHELAVVAAAGRVSLINTDTARELRRVPIGPHALSLGWSGDGQRLLVATGHRLRVFNADGRLITAEQVPPGTTITAAEISPSGRQLAYVTSQSDGRQQALLRPVADGVRGRVLLVGAALGDLAFSPGGDWLLVGWHQLGSWMFFTTGPGRTRVRQITDVPARLGHSEPIVASWCCAPSPPAADR
ncbi:MAG TPA: hypothetical protein VHW26_01715 [Solirubrobacteraceae bacterium]|nr:hypothetical protein [Solirubrobacteraceae bacterium]